MLSLKRKGSEAVAADQLIALSIVDTSCCSDELLNEQSSVTTRAFVQEDLKVPNLFVE